MTALHCLPRGLTIAAAALFLTALSPSPRWPRAAHKRAARWCIVVQPEPPTLASYQSTAGPVGQVATKVYEGLLEYDFELKPVPSLAQSWTVSADGKTVTFKLQPGVKFHDGKPFTSADVQFSVMDVLKKVHPRGVNTFRAVTAVDTPDPMTAVFRLSEPAPYMMMALSSLRVADAAQACLRQRRHRAPPQRQPAGGHRAVQVRGMAEGPVHALRHATPTTASPACRTWTAWWPASLPTPARARPRWRRKRCTWAASTPSRRWT